MRGNHADVDTPLPTVVAAAIAEDGTLFVATANQQLAQVASGTTQLVSLTWSTEWSGTVLPDGLAIAQSGSTALLVQSDTDGVWLRLFATDDVAHRRSLRLAGEPHGGVLALWPFAYYALDRTIRHVDLMSGLLETMTDVGAGAVPGAVVNG